MGVASNLEGKAAALTVASFGYNGGILLDDTTAITGVFRSMLVMANATFTILTTEYTKNGIVTLTVGSDWGTLAAGTVISGKITAVTLASGSVLLIA